MPDILVPRICTRTTDLTLRPAKVEAVQQPQKESNNPWITARQIDPSAVLTDDLGRDKHNAERHHHLDRRLRRGCDPSAAKVNVIVMQIG